MSVHYVGKCRLLETKLLRKSPCNKHERPKVQIKLLSWIRRGLSLMEIMFFWIACAEQQNVNYYVGECRDNLNLQLDLIRHCRIHKTVVKQEYITYFIEFYILFGSIQSMKCFLCFSRTMSVFCWTFRWFFVAIKKIL